MVPEVRAGDRAGPQGDQTRPAWAHPYGQDPCGDCVRPRETALECAMGWCCSSGGLSSEKTPRGQEGCDQQSVRKSESTPSRGQRRARTREGDSPVGSSSQLPHQLGAPGLGPRLAWALPRPLTAPLGPAPGDTPRDHAAAFSGDCSESLGNPIPGPLISEQDSRRPVPRRGPCGQGRGWRLTPLHFQRGR